jgi:hypothetical protein
MGSTFEANDTLQITAEQGFPAELDYSHHQTKPYVVQDFADRVFEFSNKDGIRVYHAPPVRNFLVENRNGKWIYWGLVHIIETHHDYLNKKTSGKFKIIYLYTPQEMAMAHDMIDRSPKTKP